MFLRIKLVLTCPVVLQVTNRIKRKGRSSDLFRRRSLPNAEAPVAKNFASISPFHQSCLTDKALTRRGGTHSNRHCYGFTPYSLLFLAVGDHLRTICLAQRYVLFLFCNYFREDFFLRIGTTKKLPLKRE